MKKIVFALLIFSALIGCKKKDVATKPHGSFTYNETSYGVNSIRIDHVAYNANNDFVLKFTTIPANMSVSQTTHSGYGTYLELYLEASDNELRPGKYNELSSDSTSRIISVSENGDTSWMVTISAAEINVSVAENDFTQYDFKLTDETGKSISGSFVGKPVLNYSVDQPAFGELQFDTVECYIAKPSLYKWNALFAENVNYYELKFYSSEARFNDNGKIAGGVMLVMGFHSVNSILPTTGTYNVSTTAEDMTLYYGQKIGIANWGTYWCLYMSGSQRGKANILSGSLNLNTFTDNELDISFELKDQLGNTVKGYFDGSYKK